LGNGNDTLTIGAPLGIMNAVAIAAGGLHTCALAAGGTVDCWGNNQKGQLGGGVPFAAWREPVPVPGITDAVALTAGGYHTCVLHAGGTASCWGLDRDGELGDGSSLDHSFVPVAVDLSHVGPLKQIAAGGFHTCGIVAADSTVVCWGENNVGQLGLGFHSNAERIPLGKVQAQPSMPCSSGIFVGCADIQSEMPFLKATMLAGSMGLGQVNFGQYGGFYTVALDATGQDWGWGSNNEFELNPTLGGEQDYAVKGFTPALSGASQLAAGAFHSCFVSSLSVFCRGPNNQAQAGASGSNTTAPPPTPVVLGDATKPAVDVTAGEGHTCTVVDGIFPEVVMCWGDNSYGQVNGAPGGTVIVPQILNFP
jgi:alpha-tubulin suppressor-like RCC1 family protein